MKTLKNASDREENNNKNVEQLGESWIIKLNKESEVRNDVSCFKKIIIGLLLSCRCRAR